MSAMAAETLVLLRAGPARVLGAMPCLRGPVHHAHCTDSAFRGSKCGADVGLWEPRRGARYEGRCRSRTFGCVASAVSTEETSRRPTGPGPPPQGLRGGLIDVNPPRGTRDFPPEEMRQRSWLFQNFREVILTDYALRLSRSYVNGEVQGSWICRLLLPVQAG